MIAEVIPPSQDLATKADVLAVKLDLRGELMAVKGDLETRIAILEGKMNEGFALLRGDIHAQHVSSLRWMLSFFIPVWAGTWATVVAIVLKG